MKRSLIAFAFCAVCGCQEPSEPGFSCADGLTCPPGLECSPAKRCELPGAAVDMALSEPQDLAAVVDQAAQADQAGGPTPVAGCVGLGWPVGTAFACPGTFAPAGTPASKLCASGYSLVKDASKIVLGDCQRLPGFFAGDVILTRYTAGAPNSGVCMTLPAVGQIRQFVGCGAARTNVVNLPSACAGFSQAVDCGPDPSWDCPSNSLDGATNTSATDGSICAK